MGAPSGRRGEVHSAKRLHLRPRSVCHTDMLETSWASIVSLTPTCGGKRPQNQKNQP